jgi:aconitate hydratase
MSLAITPTVTSVRETYTRMEERLAVVRQRLARPLTLSEKILYAHAHRAPSSQRGDESIGADGYLALQPDRVVLQDVLGQTAMLQLMQTGCARVRVPATIHCDHLVQARTDGLSDLRASRDENGEVYDFLRSAAARFGLGFWGPGAGIIHQIVLETYALPGYLVLGTDSHTPNAGGLGACAVGVGGAEAVETLLGLPWEVRVPRRIAVLLTGRLAGWAAPKDVVLVVASKLGVAGATNAIIEYIGPGAATISATGKATITNMGAETGATTSMFSFDAQMARYLHATGRGALVPEVEAHAALFAPDPEVLRDPAAHYERIIEVDLDRLEPHVSGPHSPDRARPISALAAEVRAEESGLVDAIATALVGSCTNSSYEDLTRAADVAAQASARGLRAKAKLFVTPGSERVARTATRDGLMPRLTEAGAVVLASACGPCIGQWRRAPDEGQGPNTIVTSYNRNFPGRNDGRTATMAFLASPEIVMALAIAGRLSFNPLTDSLVDAEGRAFRFVPPAAARDAPVKPLEPAGDAYVPPPEDGSAVRVAIDSKSTRLMALPRWPTWDGKDLTSLPVLIKTRGRTTTDQISPAGEWLRLRGHLERFSDNLLLGAVDAWSGLVGSVEDPVTGAPQRVSDVARAHRQRNVRWVIVGDENYGEGSSREHAALSPRLLGGAAVIARSFARIHESNLKKQGLLALTFADAADYERVREGDRVDLLDLDTLAPGRDVRAVLVHADGTRDELALRHSYRESQLDWFRKGSALNAAATVPR